MDQQPQPLTDRIADALAAWAERGNSPAYAAIRRPETVTANARSRAAAVMAVVEPELAALRREVELYVETLHRRDATIAQFRAALAVDHHIAYHQGEPSDGLLYHCGRDHCTAPAPASCPAD